MIANKTHSGTPLRELAARVRRGSRLLDRKMPGWRRVLYKALVDEQKQLNMADASCCMLGTIEHYIGKLRRKPTLRKGTASLQPQYAKGAERLKLSSEAAEQHGFLSQSNDRYEVYKILEELWRGEIEAGV